MEHFFRVNIYLNLKIILRGSHCYEPHFTGEEIVAESREKVSPSPHRQTACLRVPSFLTSALRCLLGHVPRGGGRGAESSKPLGRVPILGGRRWTVSIRALPEENHTKIGQRSAGQTQVWESDKVNEPHTEVLAVS